MSDEDKEKIINSHKYFSVACFNAAWDLIDKNPRTELETEQMIHLSHASFWHWTEVPGVTKTNLSVGYWQLSRVYALANQGEESLFYGKRCLDIGLENQLEPFFIAYGYEAIARAYKVLQNWDQVTGNKEIAMEYIQKIMDLESKTMVIADLDTI